MSIKHSKTWLFGSLNHKKSFDSWDQPRPYSTPHTL